MTHCDGRYAQLTRGIDKGRGIGIIDAKDLAFAPDSALLLQASGTCKSWTSDKQGKLAVWLQGYVGWLGTSPHASDEFSQTNNHGTWFDIQALSLSLYAGNVTRSRFLASNALQRVAVQIEPDGRMPMELSRTRSMHYTWWNMMAFFELYDLAIPFIFSFLFFFSLLLSCFFHFRNSMRLGLLELVCSCYIFASVC